MKLRGIWSPPAERTLEGVTLELSIKECDALSDELRRAVADFGPHPLLKALYYRLPELSGDGDVTCTGYLEEVEK